MKCYAGGWTHRRLPTDQGVVPHPTLLEDVCYVAKHRVHVVCHGCVYTVRVIHTGAAAGMACKHSNVLRARTELTMALVVVGHEVKVVEVFLRALQWLMANMRIIVEKERALARLPFVQDLSTSR